MWWPARVDRRRRLWRGWGVCGTRSRSSRVDGVPPGLACLGLPCLLSLPRLPRLPRLGKTLLPPVVRRRRSEGGPPAGRPQRRLPRSEDRCRRVGGPGCCRPGCCSHGRLARRHRRERGVGRPGYRCRRLRAEPVPRRRRLRMAEPVPRRRLCRLTVPVSRDVRLAVWGSRRVSAIQLTIGVPRWLRNHLTVPVPRRRRRPGRVDRIPPGLGVAPVGLGLSLSPLVLPGLVRLGGPHGLGRLAVPVPRDVGLAIPVPRRRLDRLTILVSRDVRLAVWGSRRVSAVQLTIGIPRWLYSLAVPVPLRVGGLQRRVWRGLRRGGRVGGWRVEAVCRLQRLCSLISRHPPPPPPLALRRGRLLLRRWRVHLRRPLPRCLIGA